MNEAPTSPTNGNDGHSIARNTAYNLLGRGLPLLVGLGTTPFVVRGFGETRFGLFSIGLAVISSFFMFDLGLGRAVAKYGAAYRAAGREREIPSLLWNAVYLQSFLGLFGGAILVAITPYLVRNVLAIPDELVAESIEIFYLLAATIVLCLTEFSFAGALEAYQRFGLLNAVRAPINIISLLFILWVAHSGGSLSLFFVFFLASRAVLTGVLLYFCGRTIPMLYHHMAPSRTSVVPLFHFGKWVTVSNLVAPALLYADRFLLATIGSLGQVAFYTAPFQIVERLLIIPGTLTSTMFPAISALDSTDARRDIQSLTAQSIHLLVCIMGLACVTLAAFAPWIVWLFFGEAYLDHSVVVFRVLLLGFAFNAIAFIPFAVVQGCGHPDITAKFHLLEFPIHLLLLYVGYHLAGLPGVACAWTLRVALDCALLLFICHLKQWLCVRDLVARKVLRNSLIFIVSGFLLSQSAWEDSIRDILLYTGSLFALLGYTIAAGLSAEDRRNILTFLRHRRV